MSDVNLNKLVNKSDHEFVRKSYTDSARKWKALQEFFYSMWRKSQPKCTRMLLDWKFGFVPRK